MKILLLLVAAPIIAWFATILYAMFAPESMLDENVIFEYLTVLALIFGGIAIGTINERKKR
jgi:hypothetical protein